MSWFEFLTCRPGFGFFDEEDIKVARKAFDAYDCRASPLLGPKLAPGQKEIVERIVDSESAKLSKGTKMVVNGEDKRVSLCPITLMLSIYIAPKVGIFFEIDTR